MPTRKQDNDFKDLIASNFIEVPATALDTAIEWAKDNLEPEDIFSETQLEKWAEANGYVKGGEQ